MTDEETRSVSGIKLRLLQSLVALNVVLVLLVLGVVLDIIPKPTLQASPTELEETTMASLARSQKQAGEDPTESAQPATTSDWREAERLFSAENYDQAGKVFAALLQAARTSSSDKLVCDYFRLRIAQSGFRLGQSEEARGLFQDLLNSASPIIRTCSFYELGLLDFGQGRYLSARMRCYQALGALGAIERPLALDADIQFLIGQCLAEKVRTFVTSERSIQWSSQAQNDPFAGLSRGKLRELLNQGKGLLNPSALGPELKMDKRSHMLGRWDISCTGLGSQEAINQIGRSLKKDQILWFWASEPARHRPVTLHFRARSPQLIVEVAAGQAGLIARYGMEELKVYEPLGAKQVAEQRAILTEEAISFWRRFFLRHPTDPRLPEGHYALAAISEWNDRKPDAIREYLILASRYQQSSVAPEALLRAARLKLEHMDYSGARKALQDMLDLYPNHAGADEVYVMLGKVQEKSGQYAEAVEIYEKLYYRDLSRRSRREAAWGAGRCYYQMGNYKEASTWLGRFVAGFSEPDSGDFAEAYFLLARAQRKQNLLDPAAEAYRRGLLGGPPADLRIPAMLELVDVHIDQEDFISALGVLDSLLREELTAEQKTDLAILQADIHRSIGLLDRARSVLKLARSQTNQDPTRQARLNAALARCHIDAGDFDQARTLLMGVLPMVTDGPVRGEISVLLGQVCLKTKKYDQAETIAKPVIEMDCPRATRLEAQRILGEVYLARKEYEKAAVMFSGMGQAPASQPAADAQVGQEEAS